MAEPALTQALPPALDPERLPRIAARTAPPPADLSALIDVGAPVVLKRAFEHWPALAAGHAGPAALNAYLKGLDLGAPAPVMEAPHASGGQFAYGADLREFSFTKRSARLPDTLDRIERLMADRRAPFVAVQMLPLADQMPDFVRQNPMPLLPADVGPRLWVGGAVKTRTHNDRDHNLACVIAGRRRFLLFPPEQVANLYVGPLDNPPPLSLVDPDAPDLERFPRYAEAFAQARVAWLEAGDAILIPRHWWHHVASLDGYNAMVNYWWGAAGEGIENPNDLFLAALLTLKSLPEGDRRYWRAMFDAFVFAEDDAAVAHIPEPLRGALGTMRPTERARLRRELAAAFAKSS